MFMTTRMKTLIIILAIVVLVAIAALIILSHPAFGRRKSKAVRAKIEASPNYRNGKFRNQTPTPQFTGKNGFAVMWGFLTDTSKDRTPAKPVDAVKSDLHNLPADIDLLVWFGHSSYLFQVGGKRFLVDPLLKPEFPASVFLHPFAGSDIYRPDDIPPIDFLIITHEHWDHLDYATLRDLREKVKHVICPLGIADYLEYWGYEPACISEMDWYDVYQSPAVSTQDKDTLTIERVTCLPSRHFSNRLFNSNQTLWASFLVEAGGRKVYIGGDGGYDHRFKEVHDHYGHIDLAFLENGQYSKDWANIHTMPSLLEQAITDLQAEQVFTVHHGKFSLAGHSWDEPDSISHDIARRKNIKLLDSSIGTIVKF